MSGLYRLLNGHQEPGMYRWSSGLRRAEICSIVERFGWRFGAVDGWNHATKADALAAVGDALEFPDYYGRNLDALNDCVGDLDGNWVLLWDGWATLNRADPRTFALMLEILGTSPSLAVLLRGAGPDLDVPTLP